MNFITWREQLGDPECPYAERWILNFGPLGSIRLHRWFRSDDKRAKHDHPSDFVTLVLKGGYVDEGICSICEGEGRVPLDRKKWPDLPLDIRTEACPSCHGDGKTYEDMVPGSLCRRKAEHRHTVCVKPGGCWTLLYFWPKRRNWGFWVPRKDTGKLRFRKANKYFLENGHHPCDQP